MDRIGVRELRQYASRYLARVANGEAIEVTDRGRPIARLVPVPSARTALDELLQAGRLKAPESDSDLEPPADFGLDASGRLAEMRSDER